MSLVYCTDPKLRNVQYNRNLKKIVFDLHKTTNLVYFYRKKLNLQIRHVL